jgi:type II secretory ATPase GspE/PulE/Tfp pilus assembly ATPase PilB-like protein
MRQEKSPQNQTGQDILPSASPTGYRSVQSHMSNGKPVWVPRPLKSDNLDDFFLGNRDDLQRLFDVEQVVLYAVDREKRELFSKILRHPLDGIQDIRVPMDEQTLSGFCAKYGRLLNIADAYDPAELARISPHLCFDRFWEEGGGIQPRQILAAPIVYNRKYLLGVLLLFNRRRNETFTTTEEEMAREVAEMLSLTLRTYYQQQGQQQTPRRSRTKFDYLLTHNFITQEELDTATDEANQRGQDVETVLIETYRVPKKEMGKSLSSFFGCPFVEYDTHRNIDRSLFKGINFDYLKANKWMPLRREGSTVDILIDNPKDLHKIEHIELLMKGCTLRFFVGLRRDIVQYLQSVSGKPDTLDSIQDILGELNFGEATEEEHDLGASVVHENDSAIVRLVNQIIVDAYQRGASDIHIEPYTARQDTVVRIRIDGECFEYQRIPPSYRRAVVSRIKIMARLDIAERRKPQDGKIKFRLPTHRYIELRVATIPSANSNEDVVMRILVSNEPIPLDQLQMNERNLRAFQHIIQRPYGLILVVGPTGSGKTTTLHGALASINMPKRKIWTAEDPIEITQYGLRQVQVNPHIGFTFAAAMRSFLRADPDVIMVGEMRDRETAHIGLEASLTGHLVLSTLHTNSAVETITRLLDMELDVLNFADALLGVLAQRLVRTLCATCKVAYFPPQETFAELQDAYGREAFANLGVQYTPDFRLYQATGCRECEYTGYRGRVSIHELLLNTEEIKQLIQSRARTTDILQRACQDGMTTLLQDGIQKVLRGLTTFQQVKAVVAPHIDQMLKEQKPLRGI